MNKKDVIVFRIKKKTEEQLVRLGIKKRRDLFDESGRVIKTFFGQPVVASKDGNENCFQILSRNEPCMIARIGTIEMGAINACMAKQVGLTKNIKDENKQLLSNNAGFFGNGSCITDDEMMRFYQEYCDAMKQVDLMAVFGTHAEDLFVKEYADNNIKLMQLCSLEPYYFNDPWSKVLKGKKVLVIHPFAQSIMNQYEKREGLFPGTDILPEFSLKTIKAVQTIGSERAGYKNWFEALEKMKTDIGNCDFDIAIIGCGAYGFPLAAYIKEMGKKAIVMAGSTQILFGIKGKRWDDNPLINKYYNSCWIRPSDTERPPEASNVEQGCYW